MAGSRYDLECKTTLSLSEALLGFDRIILTHLDGSRLRLSYDRAIDPSGEQRLKVNGQGLWSKDGQRGNLWIEVAVDQNVADWVNGLSEDQRKTLASLLPRSREVETSPDDDIVRCTGEMLSVRWQLV